MEPSLKQQQTFVIEVLKRLEKTRLPAWWLRVLIEQDTFTPEMIHTLKEVIELGIHTAEDEQTAQKLKDWKDILSTLQERERIEHQQEIDEIESMLEEL